MPPSSVPLKSPTKDSNKKDVIDLSADSIPSVRSRKTKDKISYADFRARHEAGRCIFIYEQDVYDTTSWVSRHPGGPLLISHMSGLDVTHQIRGYHSKEFIETRLKSFHVGAIADYRPSDLDLAFRELAVSVEKDGLYDTNYFFYIRRVIIFAIVFAMVWAMVLYGPVSFAWYMFTAAVLAYLWQQMAFVAHDTGHCGISHDMTFDHTFGVLMANTIGGLSIGWWKDSHNLHHMITNDVEHDPDIQHLPFFAVSNKFFNNVYSTYYQRQLTFDQAATYLIPFQHFSYYPVLLFGRFNLYANTFRYLLTTPKVYCRKLELTCIAIFWCWYLTMLSFLPDMSTRIWFTFVSHALTFLLHVQITLSHFSMSTESSPHDEEFVKHQLRTTLNVDCPEWLDWFHGGLQFQVEHHLFPRVPRHNLRTVRNRVREFAALHGLTYNEKTFIDGNKHTISCLREVAEQVKFLAKVGLTPPSH